MPDRIPLNYEVRQPRRRSLTPAMGLTLAFLLVALGLVGVIFWARMVRYRQGGNRAPACSLNLRQLGLAAQMYAGEHRGVFPDSLETALLTEGLSAEVFTCPSGADDKASGTTAEQVAANIHSGGHCSFVYVGANLSTSSAAGSIMAFEFPSNHGMDGGHLLYADGNVSYETLGTLVQLVPALEAGQNPPKFATLTQAQAKTICAQRWLPQLTAMQSGQWEKMVTNQPTTQPIPATQLAVP